LSKEIYRTIVYFSPVARGNLYSLKKVVHHTKLGLGVLQK